MTDLMERVRVALRDHVGPAMGLDADDVRLGGRVEAQRFRGHEVAPEEESDGAGEATHHFPHSARALPKLRPVLF